MARRGTPFAGVLYVRAGADLPRPAGRRVQRPLRRPRDPGGAGPAAHAAGRGAARPPPPARWTGAPPLRWRRRRRGHGGRRRARLPRRRPAPGTRSPAWRRPTACRAHVLHAGTPRPATARWSAPGGRVLSRGGTGADLAAARRLRVRGGRPDHAARVAPPHRHRPRGRVRRGPVAGPIHRCARVSRTGRSTGPLIYDTSVTLACRGPSRVTPRDAASARTRGRLAHCRGGHPGLAARVLRQGARPLRARGRPGGTVLVVASDRISAFDHVLATPIPDKGAILTALTLWWFDRLAGPAGPAEPPARRRRSRPWSPAGRWSAGDWTMYPVECVARGYLTGSGLAEYAASGEVCGVALPAGPGRRPTGCRSRSSRPPPRPPSASTTRTCPSTSSPGRSATRRPTRLRDAHPRRLRARPSRSPRERGIILADTKLEFGPSAPDGGGTWSSATRCSPRTPPGSGRPTAGSPAAPSRASTSSTSGTG